VNVAHNSGKGSSPPDGGEKNLTRRQTRSADAYAAIEKGMIEIEQALMSDKPDIDKVSALVNETMRPYNAALAEVAKEARSRR
jgi:hypothetical protein